MKSKETIERINRSLKVDEEIGNDPNEIGWGDQKGILITVNEAKLFIELLNKQENGELREEAERLKEENGLQYKVMISAEKRGIDKATEEFKSKIKELEGKVREALDQGELIGSQTNSILPKFRNKMKVEWLKQQGL
jgi:hypothetical protein